jgi:hypothetical protein
MNGHSSCGPNRRFECDSHSCKRMVSNLVGRRENPRCSLDETASIYNLIDEILDLPDCKLGLHAVEYRTGPSGNAQQPEEARIKS